jgi:prepilin peptidase CpaA
MRSFAWWPTLIVLAVATFTDLRSRRIPNWLVFPFLLAGIVVSPWRHDWGGNSQGVGWHGLGHFGWNGVGQSFAGLGLGLLIYGIPFCMGWTGGGDVKLCAAIGAWIGPEQTLWAVFFTAIAGGIVVLCWAAWSGFMKVLFMGAGNLVFGRKKRGQRRDAELCLTNPLTRKVPYAPAIALGTLMSFFAR